MDGLTRSQSAEQLHCLLVGIYRVNTGINCMFFLYAMNYLNRGRGRRAIVRTSDWHLGFNSLTKPWACAAGMGVASVAHLLCNFKGCKMANAWAKHLAHRPYWLLTDRSATNDIHFRIRCRTVPCYPPRVLCTTRWAWKNGIISRYKENPLKYIEISCRVSVNNNKVLIITYI